MVAYRADVSHFFIIGRFVTAISGVLVVVVAYLVARELRISVFWASVVAVMLAVSWPMVEYSSIVRMDMLLTALLLATVLVMLRALERPTTRAFAIAGVFLGLAVTSKYPGLMAVLPILFVNMTLTIEGRITPRRGLILLGVAALASFITAFVIAPFLFINFRETLAWVLGEARGAHLGATGSGFVADLWRYLTEAMPTALGLLGTAIGIVGSMVMLARRRPRILSLTFWGFAAFISFLSLWWLRWSLPLVPLLAIAMAFVLSRAQVRLADRIDGRAVRTVAVLLAAALVLPLTLPTADFAWSRLQNDDVRFLAIDWIHENVPDGATLLTDTYTTQVRSDRYDVVVAQENELVHWADYAAKLRPYGYFGQLPSNWTERTPEELLADIEAIGVDYIVLARPWIDFYEAEQDAYAHELAVYQALLDSYPVVAEFDGRDAALGWTQLILDADSSNSSS